MNIKSIVKGNEVRFSYYRQGTAYYLVYVEEKQSDYIFPVSLEDIGNASLFASDNAIMFMRYIRRAINDGSFVQA